MSGVELYRASPGPYKGRAQQWRFRFRAPNGRIIAVGSESYTNRGDAVAALRLVFGSHTTFIEPDAVPL